MTDIPLRPELFRPEAIAADTAQLNAGLIELMTPLPNWWNVGAQVARDAAFRTVNMLPGVVKAGRLYFCQHRTRDLVWRDEWRHHANGAIGIARAVIAAADPSVLGMLFEEMFGADAVTGIDGGYALAVGLSRFEIVTPRTLAAMFGEAAPSGEGRTEFMAALTLRTRSVETAAGTLAANGVGTHRDGTRLVVPAGEAFGVTLEFVD